MSPPNLPLLRRAARGRPPLPTGADHPYLPGQTFNTTALNTRKTAVFTFLEKRGASTDVKKQITQK